MLLMGDFERYSLHRFHGGWRCQCVVPRTVEISWIILLSTFFFLISQKKKWLDNVKCKQNK